MYVHIHLHTYRYIYMCIYNHMYTAAHCNRLKNSATHCNTQQRTPHTRTCSSKSAHCARKLQISSVSPTTSAARAARTAMSSSSTDDKSQNSARPSKVTSTHVGSTQHAATHCNTLQLTATSCNAASFG